MTPSDMKFCPSWPDCIPEALSIQHSGPKQHLGRTATISYALLAYCMTTKLCWPCITSVLVHSNIPFPLGTTVAWPVGHLGRRAVLFTRHQTACIPVATLQGCQDCNSAHSQEGLPECCVFTGPPTVTPVLQSPFSGVPAADAPAPASATVQSPGSSKRHKLTACALAIMGLRQLPEAQGTAKQITAAVETDSALAQHLNW